jgi:hypothetical protein
VGYPFARQSSKVAAKSWNFKLHPAVEVACSIIADLVNTNLPDFISKNYRFVLKQLAPEDWGEHRRLQFGLSPLPSHDPSPPYSEAELNAMSGLGRDVARFVMSDFQKMVMPSESVIPLESLGAGIRRWVKVLVSMIRNSANLILIDWAELDAAVVARVDADVIEEMDSREYRWALWDCFCEIENGPSLIRFEGIREGGVLFIDEPEAALHPEGVESIRRWIENQAVTFGTVFVATHSLKIFDTDFPSTNRFVLKAVSRQGQLRFGHPGGPFSTRERILEPAEHSSSAFPEWAEEMGFTRGETLLMTRYFLFVEGPHDAILINEFFGSLLARHGIRVIPLHGLNRAKSLADAEIVSELDIPIGVLVDNFVEGRKSGESKQIDRMLRELKSSGKSADVYGLSAPDILDYLPVEVVAKRCRKPFPGWERARLAHASSCGERGETDDFKQWLQKEFKVSLSREDVRVMAYETMVRGLVPTEIESQINKVLQRVRLG